MKRFLLILALGIGCSLLTSCEEPTILTVSDTSISFGEVGGSKALTLVANKIWNASCDQEWCTISPTLGDGAVDTNFDLILKCEPNNDFQDRVCTISIQSDEKTISLIVTQKERTGITGIENEYNVSYEAQTITINFKSNVEFEVVGFKDYKDWISIVDTKGLSNSEIILSIAENEGYKRSGKIRVKYRGGRNVVYGDGHVERQVIDGHRDVTINQGENPLVNQYVEFGSSAFKNYCLKNFDNNKDGEVSFYEALQGKWIGISKMNIESLLGIEAFRNLEYLDCNYNKITNLDLSNNTELVELYCKGNPLSVLDISSCTKLTELNCNNCGLNILDVSKNASLIHLYCSGNLFTSLDVSNHSSLSSLDCSQGALISLETSGCTSLGLVNCSDNQLTTINISDCKTPMGLECANNQLTNLIFNGISFSYLVCNNNKLKTLDVSGCADMSRLCCYNNLLTNLNVTGCTSLQEFRCEHNQLGALDISGCTGMRNLYCDNNLLTNLNITGCSSLWEIQCEHNQLRTLDVSGCILLYSLKCQNNPYLTEIWLRTGQWIEIFLYDKDVATIKYK